MRSGGSCFSSSSSALHRRLVRSVLSRSRLSLSLFRSCRSHFMATAPSFLFSLLCRLYWATRGAMPVFTVAFALPFFSLLASWSGGVSLFLACLPLLSFRRSFCAFLSSFDDRARFPPRSRGTGSSIHLVSILVAHRALSRFVPSLLVFFSRASLVLSLLVLCLLPSLALHSFFAIYTEAHSEYLCNPI